MLASLRHGPPSSNPSLLILHGLFGSAENWNLLSKRISQSASVCVHSLSLRNHGGSPRFDTHTSADMAEDVLAYADKTFGSDASFHVLGHSMGAKVAMMLALARPNRVEKLACIDMAPKVYPLSPLMKHYITTMMSIEEMNVSDIRQADELMRHTIPEQTIRSFLLKSLKREQDGCWRFQLNLSVLLESFEGLSEWNGVGSFQNEALFIAGLKSDYIKREDEAIIKHHFPNSRIDWLDAGHWVHAEQPEKVVQAVSSLLNS